MTEVIDWGKEVSYSTVELEKIKLVAVAYLDSRLVQFAIDPEVEVISQLDFTLETLAIRVVQMVFGREVQRQECRWPADWWQAFKEQWCSPWALARWPVQYKEYVITARELYPGVALPSPRYNAVIAIDKVPGW